MTKGGSTNYIKVYKRDNLNESILINADLLSDFEADE